MKCLKTLQSVYEDTFGETFRSGLRCSSIFMSLTYSCDSLPPEQESESSGWYLSLLRLCPLDSCGWVLYSALEKGHMRANAWGGGGGGGWQGRRWRDRYREIQKGYLSLSPSQRAKNHSVHDRSPTPGGGDLYETLFIGNFNPGDRWDCSQPAGQPDNDESSQDSPVTLPWKAREIMYQRLYVELCVGCRCMWRVCTGVWYK